ncbi:protein of unknown function [Methylocella tundrae]|uniref:Nicotinate-nucleotide--dimethylbenzimidazole phosphoribosyltransferase n=1 Tax=Methylocella tundrae TaxID=227605 RepID=A0A4U8Z5S3_METTU|nr:protein of unknown function [Methylocella tundrae]
MLAEASPFDSIRNLIALMPQASESAAAAVRARQAELTKPQGSLGRLEEIAEFFAAWQGKPIPSLDRPLVAIFAANHGVAAKGVSAYPASVTRAMMENFSSGGAAINQICGAPSALASRCSTSPSTFQRRTSRRSRRWRRRRRRRPSPSEWRRSRAKSISSVLARWGSATPPSPRRFITGSMAAWRKIGLGAEPGSMTAR